MKSILINNRGSALLIALSIMIMLTIIALAAANRSQTDIDMSFNQLHEEQAFYVAEAGVKQALVEINEDDKWRAGYDSVAFGRGLYSVILVDSLADTTLFDTVLIQSTGIVSEAVASVEFTTIPIYRRPFAYAMFGEAGINLDAYTCTDSYNSDSGTYASTKLDSLGSVGSNGTISSSKFVTFGGDVSVATPGGISLGADNTVNGDTTSTADSVDLGMVPDSEFDWAKANSAAPGGISGTGYAYSNGQRTLTTVASGNAVLSAGVYYFTDITLGQNSTLSVAAGASVVLYVTGDIVLNQGSTINNGGKPSDMIIYSKGSKLQFDQDNIFYGAFFGPLAHVQYDQTTQVFGSIVGYTVQLDKNACLHFDRSLYGITKGTTGEMIAIAWQELN